MCGIVGIWIKNNKAISELNCLEKAIQVIKHRGPDNLSVKTHKQLGLAHARLSIIDLSSEANQPMTSSKGNLIVFNGEIYNYKELRKKLLINGHSFKTDSDTEVLLAYIENYGIDSVKDLNGFFSFLFYDLKNDLLYFARDRFGIKPLYIYEDDDKIIFASEIASFYQFNIDKSLSNEALKQLFGLTYIPAPLSILNNASQVLPGHYGCVSDGEVVHKKYYSVDEGKQSTDSFDTAKKEVKKLLKQAVQRRMVSDVELGTFLSGGLDSSIVSAISKEFKNDLKTFSIGFESQFFDESKYANLLAKHINSNHHSLTLSKSDFQENFQTFISSIDEPFADSSAFAVYLLSKYTKENVTVCLSGDGADELFGGYRKHEAEFKFAQLSKTKRLGLKTIANLMRNLPNSRMSKLGDVNRKLQKFVDGFELSPQERYWKWANFISQKDRTALIKHQNRTKYFSIPQIGNDLNDLLIADQKTVLANDMLVKVDRMSMQHSLEVRTPFLDHELVDYVNSLPAEFKVNKNGRKQLLVEAFKDDIPEVIYKRDKKGFEIPIFEWLDSEIQTIFDSQIFSEYYIKEQGIFNYNYIYDLQKNWKNKQFGDKIYLVWCLIVFQNWWDRHYK